MSGWPRALLLALRVAAALAAAAAAGGAGPRRSAGCCTRWARGRREVALRNVELCLPELPAAERRGAGARALPVAGPQPARARPALVCQPGAAAAADPRRGRRQAGRAQRAAGDVAGAALHGAGRGRRGDAAVPDAPGGVDLPGAEQHGARRRDAPRPAALRPGPRSSRATRARCRWCAPSSAGAAFFNLPDMDFGPRDAAFVPFFGVPAATLLAPSRMARALKMVVQPVVAEMLPGGQGYRVRFLPPWTDWPSDDAEADARRMNAWIEERDPRATRRSTCGCTSASRRGRRASRRCTTEPSPIIRADAAEVHQDAGRGQRLRRARRHRARRVELTPAQVRRLGDRRFGVGADQILVVEPQPHAGRRLPLPHLQQQRRRGRALRQRRALLRALRARARPDRQDARVRVRDRQQRARAAPAATTAASPWT